MDVPLDGRRFIWYNTSATNMSRIDRVLISSNMLTNFGDIKLLELPKGLSDHLPLLFHNEVVDFGQSPLRFFHYWFNYPDFYDKVTESFTNYEYVSMGSFLEKLKYLKTMSRSWIKDKEVVNARKESLDRGQKIEDKKKLIVELDQMNKVENEDTFHKARIKWDIKGEENSKVFHNMLKQRRMGQMIKTKLLNSNSNQVLPDLRPDCELSADHCLDLEGDVTEAEIRSAVWDCRSDKSPRPDGFTFELIKLYWDCFRSDLVFTISLAFRDYQLTKGARSAFITLIPKVVNPSVINDDYRPIFLIGVQYKIIYKILANRIAKVVDSIICKEQSAFITGRQILDGSLVLSGTMDWYKKMKKNNGKT
ncbi:uncharacterized protein [Rutidosis leptorrhynchoides]|uniref:uncharacterized protein n=1 Tax=Rutidosis leptorrhynchoides TaxID=125765 RepID=UPI003A98D72A